MYVISIFVATLLAASFYGYRKLDVSKVIDLLNILSNAIQASKKSSGKIKVENSVGIIDLGNTELNLPTFKTNKFYDIICFKHHDGLPVSPENPEKKHHKIDLHIDEEHKIPFTLFRINEHMLHIPFKPKDIEHTILYVAIKHISDDHYSVYKFTDNEHINFYEISEDYEIELLKQNENVELAEAYD
jgi:hypothetical protein